MKTILEEFTERQLHFPLKYINSEEEVFSWELTKIIESADFFQSLLRDHPLTSINSVDDYLNYWIVRKIALFEGFIPEIVHVEQQTVVQALVNEAKNQRSNVKIGDLIKFVNREYAGIFDEKYHMFRLADVTFELIKKYSGGVQKPVFEFLVENEPYRLIDNFTDFEDVFESNPELFEKLFADMSLTELSKRGFEEILSIFLHVKNKGNTNLKPSVDDKVERITTEMSEKVKTITEEEALLFLHIFTPFFEFLKRIGHAKANEFSKYEIKLDETMGKHLEKSGQQFEFSISSSELIEGFKQITEPLSRTLRITHSFENSDDGIIGISRLCEKKPTGTALIDMVSVTYPTDSHYTPSLQNFLDIIAFVESSAILSFWHDEKLLDELLATLAFEVNFISDCTESEYEHLINDFNLLTGMLSFVLHAEEKSDEAVAVLVYGLANFLCAFTDKMLRILFVDIMKERVYVPMDKATLGATLNPHNAEILEVFGEEHVKHLAYFLLRDGEKKIGYNYRNRLAHWSNIESKELTVSFAARLWWLFMDVVNTIFWHYFKKE